MKWYINLLTIPVCVKHLPVIRLTTARETLSHLSVLPLIYWSTHPYTSDLLTQLLHKMVQSGMCLLFSFFVFFHSRHPVLPCISHYYTKIPILPCCFTCLGSAVMTNITCLVIIWLKNAYEIHTHYTSLVLVQIMQYMFSTKMFYSHH